MAQQRMGPGGRPGGARFAQFKLVLLGIQQRYRRMDRKRLTAYRRVRGWKGAHTWTVLMRCWNQSLTSANRVRLFSDSSKYVHKILQTLWQPIDTRDQDQFDDYRESTIGAAFLTQTITLDENTTVKFEIWDTAGQERYKSLAPMYYRNANCAVVVYDITQAVCGQD
jgi:hypothetical protein